MQKEMNNTTDGCFDKDEVERVAGEMLDQFREAFLELSK